MIPHRMILSLFFQGDIDLMFGFKENVPSRAGVSYLELFQTPICCAISSEHIYAGRDEIRESDLYTERIILCNSYSLPSKSADLQNKLKQHFLPESTYYCDNLSVLLTLIKAGYGFGILPEININDPELHAIPFAPEISVSFGIFYNDTQNPALKEFLSIIREMKKD